MIRHCSDIVHADLEREESGEYRTAVSVLSRYWGYDSFRAGQWPIIRAAGAGRDVFGILPTGGGKSLCYQIPGLLRGGLTLVISPLISLMEDQVSALRRRGIAAVSLSSLEDRKQLMRRLRDPGPHLADSDPESGASRPLIVYSSPERVLTDRFLRMISRIPVRLLAVDEAHCISEWGHDFRPEYRRIAELRSILDPVPVIAVTATATPLVQRDIVSSLKLRRPVIHVGGFDRSNLVFSVFRTSARERKSLEILAAIPGPAIIYVPTRRQAENWAGFLTEAGHRAHYYHGGLELSERRRVQQRWMGDPFGIMVATSAFGMGIDRPDVRSVLHIGLPPSLEAYYQEAGRAGRNGARAYATLLFSADDRLRMVADRYPAKDPVKKRGRNQRRRMLRYAESVACRRRSLQGHFGAYSVRDCGTCDICIGRHRGLIFDKKATKRVRGITEAVESGKNPYSELLRKGVPRYRIAELLEWMQRYGFIKDSGYESSGWSISAGSSESDGRADSDLMRKSLR